MKNKPYTKLLDYDSLIQYLQNVDYDLMNEIMEFTQNEILYFSIIGYLVHKKETENV